MSDLYDPRTRRPTPHGGDQTKRSLAIKLGIVGAGLVGGYGLMSGRACTAPPDAQSPEAMQMGVAAYQQMKDEYEQCRRRRTSSSTTRSASRSMFRSFGSSRSSISRGGFGRSGSFGG